MNSATRILVLNASANTSASGSKKLGAHLLDKLLARFPDSEIRERDLNQDLSFIDSDWIAANLTDAESRTPEQRQRLQFSDQLIAELEWADRIVLTTPMYNFGIPATLKAWIDLVCRAGITFRYTSNGPVGLLQDKIADVVITTGGAPLQSPVDFVSGYLKQVLGFIGIDDVRIYGADRMNVDADASFARAISAIDSKYEAVAA